MFKFIPFTASGAISDKVIRSGIFLQNKFLHNYTALTNINIQNLDWVVPTSSQSFKEIALSIDIPVGAAKLFSSIQMGATNNKAHLITTKSVLSHANEWMDNFTQEMIKLEVSTIKWKELTGYEEPT